MGQQKGQMLASERVIIQSKMIFVGSAKRFWRPMRGRPRTVVWTVGLFFVMAILMAWVMVIVWYAFFGVLVIPFRLIRRGQRKEKLAKLRHREMLEAISQQQSPTKID